MYNCTCLVLAASLSLGFVVLRLRLPVPVQYAKSRSYAKSEALSGFVSHFCKFSCLYSWIQALCLFLGTVGLALRPIYVSCVQEFVKLCSSVVLGKFSASRTRFAWLIEEMWFTSFRVSPFYCLFASCVCVCSALCTRAPWERPRVPCGGASPPLVTPCVPCGVLYVRSLRFIVPPGAMHLSRTITRSQGIFPVCFARLQNHLFVQSRCVGFPRLSW